MDVWARVSTVKHSRTLRMMDGVISQGKEGRLGSRDQAPSLLCKTMFYPRTSRTLTILNLILTF